MKEEIFKMDNEFDFSGYATRNDLVCNDGRIIRRNAFKHCDGEQVPLVYSHDHKDVKSVIGHAILENREDGVYAYGSEEMTTLAPGEGTTALTEQMTMKSITNAEYAGIDDINITITRAKKTEE